VLASHHPVKVVAGGQLLGVVDSPQILEVIAGGDTGAEHQAQLAAGAAAAGGASQHEVLEQ
jgi:hypothetical protein